VADRQFSKRVESGRCPTDVAIVAGYVRAFNIETSAELLDVAEERLRRWAGAVRGIRNAFVIEAIRLAYIMRQQDKNRAAAEARHKARKARIEELSGAIEAGLEEQKKAEKELFNAANLMRSEVVNALDRYKAADVKKADRTRKRLAKVCGDFETGFARASMGAQKRKDGSSA
jgi:hypothetical protein